MILENAKFTDVCESVYEALDEECEKAPEHMRDAYFMIANYLRERVTADPSLSEKLKGKKIADAYKKIENEARQIHAKNKGSCVFIPPERAMAIVSEYCFGKSAVPSPDPKPAPTPTAPKKEEKSGVVDLFDLI